MNLNEIKQILEKVGCVAIFGQDGSKMVVLSWGKYKELFDFDSNREETAPRLNFLSESKNGLSFVSDPSDQETIERLNLDIAILKEEIRKKELEELEGGMAVDE